MFLDLGRANGGSDWVYAYGIDGNWRTSFSKLVPDPTAPVPRPGSEGPGAGGHGVGVRRRSGCRRLSRSGPATSTRSSRCSSTSGATTPRRRSGWRHTTSTGIAQGGVVWNRASGGTSTPPGASTPSSSTRLRRRTGTVAAPAQSRLRALPLARPPIAARQARRLRPHHAVEVPLRRRAGPVAAEQLVRTRVVARRACLLASACGGCASTRGRIPRVPSTGNLALEDAWPLVSRVREGQGARAQ